MRVSLKLWQPNGDIVSDTFRMYRTILEATRVGYASGKDFSVCEKPNQKLKLYWSGRQNDMSKPGFDQWEEDAHELDVRHGFDA